MTSTSVNDSGRILLIPAAVSATWEWLAAAAEPKMHPAKITVGNHRLFRQQLIAAGRQALYTSMTGPWQPQLSVTV